MTDEKGRPVSFWGGKSVEPIARPAPVQPVWVQPDHLQKAQKAPFLCRVEPHKRDDFVPLYTTPPAAQRQWVGLTDDEMYLNCPNWLSHEQCKAWLTQIEAKLKEKNTAAQPAVPLTDDQIRGLTPKPDGVAEGNVRRVEVLPGVMGTEFDEVDAWSMPLVLQIARSIEAAHGITKGQP
jgi:hypothetical protein